MVPHSLNAAPFMGASLGETDVGITAGAEVEAVCESEGDTLGEELLTQSVLSTAIAKHSASHSSAVTRAVSMARRVFELCCDAAISAICARRAR